VTDVVPGALPEVMPSKRPQVMVADFDSELVVLVPEARLSHHLDAGLSLVLDSCDGVTGTEAVVAEIAAGTGESPEAVRVWLANCLRELVALEMVDPAEMP
jgi:hypothetical protein